MRLTYVGMMGLVFGLAVYGCSDDGGSSGGNTGGTDTGGGDTGGSDTGGGDTGGTGGGTGGSSTGGMGGAMGGMGGMAMGGMGGGTTTCDVDTEPETIEEACDARCGVHQCLAAIDEDCAAAMDEDCVLNCMDEAGYADDDGCSAEYLAFVACEAATPADPAEHQCSGWIRAPECEDEGNAYVDCYSVL